jgi:hypothetical protein
MARRPGTFRNQRIDDKICELLEQRMATEHRRGSLNAYIEEILDKWVSGLIEENAIYKGEIKQRNEDTFVAGLNLNEQTIPSRKVHRVGPAKGVIEDDERKRKAS